MMGILGLLGMLIVILGLVYTYYLGKRQKEESNEIQGAIGRHRVLLNPTLLAYVLIVIFMIVVILCFALFFRNY